MAKKNTKKSEQEEPEEQQPQPIQEERIDNLVDSILDVTKKQFKNLGSVGRKLSEDESASVVGWVDTGSTGLNLAISNRKHGGWPVGKISEVYGGEQSGKSLLAAYAVKHTQERGGVGIIFDTEAAMTKEYMIAIGVNPERCIVYDLEKLEDIFEAIENIIVNIREKDRKALVTIVVDSIMGATTQAESESDYGKDGWATSKSIILSKAMRKLTPLIYKQNICVLLTNQVRTKMGATFGDLETTSGGKAIPFHSSVRVYLKKAGTHQGKIGSEDTAVGVKTKATVKKNRVGPPLRTVTFDIFFDRGVDNDTWWFDFLKNNNVIKGSGAWNSWNLPPESPFLFLNDKKFYQKDFSQILIDNDGLKEYLYDVICDLYIMKYNSSHEMELETLLGDDDE